MTQNIVSGYPEYDFPNKNDKPLDEQYVKCKCKHLWTEHTPKGCEKKKCRCKRYE